MAARREEIDWVHSEGVHLIVPVQECRGAGMKPLDLVWVDTDKSVDPTRKKIRSRLCAREYKAKKQGKIQRALPVTQVFSAMPLLEAVKVLVSFMMSVSLSNKGKPLKLRPYDISRAHFPTNSPETQKHQTSRRGSSEVWRRQRWQIGQEHVRNSVRKFSKRQTQCSIVPQSESRCENGSAWR